jgi:hypothetical protein
MFKSKFILCSPGLQAPMVAPSKAKPSDVAYQRDSKYYSPCSNLFLLKAHLFLYKSATWLFTPKLTDMCSRSVDQIKKCLGKWHKKGYAAQPMKEGGVTSLLQSKLKSCFELYLSQFTMASPTIDIMHQSAAHFQGGDPMNEAEVDISVYLNVHAQDSEDVYLLPVAIAEYTKGIQEADIINKKTQTSLYAHSMFDQHNYFESGVWVPILAVIISEESMLLLVYSLTLEDGKYLIAETPVGSIPFTAEGFARLVAVLANWSILCLNFLSLKPQDGAPFLKMPVSNTIIVDNKVYKSFDYREMSGKHENFKYNIRDPKQFSKYMRSLTYEVKESHLQIISYDFIEGGHIPLRAVHLRDICVAVERLHKENIVHGDIRLSNMIFSTLPDSSSSASSSSSSESSSSSVAARPSAAWSEVNLFTPTSPSAATDANTAGAVDSSILLAAASATASQSTFVAANSNANASSAQLIDFDFSGEADVKHYPQWFNRNIEDGERHTDAVEMMPLKLIHDLYSLAYIFKKFTPADETLSDAWANVVTTLESGELTVAIDALGNNVDLSAELTADMNLVTLFVATGSPIARGREDVL